MNYQPQMVHMGAVDKASHLLQKPNNTNGKEKKLDETEKFDELLNSQLQGVIPQVAIWNMVTPILSNHPVSGKEISIESLVHMEPSQSQDSIMDQTIKGTSEILAMLQDVKGEGNSSEQVQNLLEQVRNVPGEGKNLAEEVDTLMMQSTTDFPDTSSLVGQQDTYSEMDSSFYEGVLQQKGLKSTTSQQETLLEEHAVFPAIGMESASTVTEVNTQQQVKQAVPIRMEHTMEELPGVIVDQIHQQENQVVIRMAPKELGSIEISMEYIEGETHITIQCEQETTKELLGKSVEELTRIIEGATKAETVVVVEYENAHSSQYKGQEEQSHARQQAMYNEIPIDENQEQVEEQQFIDLIQQLRLGLL